MKMGLEGKIVLVTGSSGGIGAAIAENFANEKAKVILHYNSNLKAAQELGSKLSKLTEILIVQADLSNETSVRDMFNEIEKAVGYVDVLVANAGVCLDYGTPIHKKTLEKWNETLSVNLTSIFLCVREFFKGIVKAQTTAPSIVFIGSTAGVFGEAFDSDYAASKAPLNAGLLLTLKNEITKIAPLGRVNTICPSWTLTEMVKTELGDPSHVKRALLLADNRTHIVVIDEWCELRRDVRHHVG